MVLLSETHTVTKLWPYLGITKNLNNYKLQVMQILVFFKSFHSVFVSTPLNALENRDT